MAEVNFFETESIRLSMRNPETGRMLNASVYTLEGVTNGDGSLREMSIGQLVMAVCLSRATKLEDDIVAMMSDMAQNTDDLDLLSNVEQEIADWQSNNKDKTLVKADIKESENPYMYKYMNSDWLTSVGVDSTVAGQSSWSSDDLTTIMTAIEKQMDAKNTISQTQLIEMQALTSKRDDTYSLISNVLKSLYTVLTGNANNL